MRRLAAALVLTVAACSGGGADVGGDEDDRDGTTTTTTVRGGDTTTTEAAAADADLAAVRAGLAPADVGHRFSYTVFGETVRGEVESPDRYRILTKFESIRFEVLVVDGTAYTREAGEDDLETAPYVVDEIGPEDTDEVLEFIEEFDVPEDEIAFLLTSAVAQAAALEPVRLAKAVLVPGAEVTETADGGVHVRGRVDLVAILGPEVRDLPDVEVVVQVELDADGAPLRVRLPPAQRGQPAVDIAIRDHGADITVAAPPPEAIDRTPNVAEEALVAFTDTPLVAPQPLPSGVRLVYVDVLPPDETLEGCTQVLLGYETESFDFLDLYIVPAACVLDFDAAPFDQTFGGFPSREAELLEVLVGDTVVQFDSGLPDFALETLARTLAPIAAADLIAQVDPG